MSWNAYRVMLRLQAPMHVGRAKLGNLQITRPYVHGKALWGALTARITRDTPHLGQDYRAVGKQVNRELAFSYFYPSTGERVDLWPWDQPERFAWLFLGSYASTALNYTHQAAAEGALHETEFIAPTTRSGEPVYLVGYIFEAQGCTLPWQQALQHLQLGGERTYGWGRVSLHKAPTPASQLFERYALDLQGARPVVTLQAHDALLAHGRAVGDRAISATGRVVPLVGRETHDARAHGRVPSEAIICWEPGSTVATGERIAIGPYGIWEAAK